MAVKDLQTPPKRLDPKSAGKRVTPAKFSTIAHSHNTRANSGTKLSASKQDTQSSKTASGNKRTSTTLHSTGKKDSLTVSSGSKMGENSKPGNNATAALKSPGRDRLSTKRRNLMSSYSKLDNSTAPVSSSVKNAPPKQKSMDSETEDAKPLSNSKRLHPLTKQSSTEWTTVTSGTSTVNSRNTSRNPEANTDRGTTARPKSTRAVDQGKSSLVNAGKAHSTSTLSTLSSQVQGKRKSQPDYTCTSNKFRRSNSGL